MPHYNDRRTVMTTTLVMAFFAFILMACSQTGNKVSIDARFLNMNQADFYVYSPDGAISGIDTIHVQGGRFTYNKEIQSAGTLVIVFPNYAVMPVFVAPGADISIDANAAHLKTMDITGTDDNEAYTTWRQNSDKLSPKEMTHHAELFIKDNPKSVVSLWLIRQYFLQAARPDIKKAQAMLRNMTKAMTPEEKTTPVGLLTARLSGDVSRLRPLAIGDPLPRFTAKDINGKPVLQGALLKGTTAVCVWATWNYESRNMLRQLASNQRDAPDSVRLDHVVTICLDPDPRQCRETLKSCAAEDLTTICDSMMWDSPLIKTLAVSNIPYNLKARDGKVTGRNIPVSDLLKKKK